MSERTMVKIVEDFQKRDDQLKGLLKDQEVSYWNNKVAQAQLAEIHSDLREFMELALGWFQAREAGIPPLRF